MGDVSADMHPSVVVEMFWYKSKLPWDLLLSHVFFLCLGIKFLWVRENIVLTFGPDKTKRLVSIATDSSNWVIMGEMFWRLNCLHFGLNVLQSCM